MSIAQSITTAQQLLDAGDIGRCELVRGELIMMSPAGANHGQVAMELARRLANHVAEHKLGTVFAAETGFMIQRNPDTVRAPDVAFVKAQRSRAIPQRGFFIGAPDLAVEVLSPDDVATEVLAKVQDWINAGCSQVWIVDPKHRTVSVYDRNRPLQSLSDDQEVTGGELLPGFRVRVSELFS